MGVKQETYSHTPPGSNRASPKTSVLSSSRDGLYPVESGSPRIPYSGSNPASRSASRDGMVERSGSFPVMKGARKADFSMSGKGVEQINLASSSSSSMASAGLEGGQYSGRGSDHSWISGSSPMSEVDQRGQAVFNEQDFSSTLIREDRQVAVLDGTSGGASPGEMLMPETFQLPVHMLSSISGVGGGSGQGKPAFVNSGAGLVGKGLPTVQSVDENRLSNRGASHKMAAGMSVEGKTRERSKRRGSSSGPLDDQSELILVSLVHATSRKKTREGSGDPDVCILCLSPRILGIVWVTV